MQSDISNIYTILNKSKVVRVKSSNFKSELLIRRDYKYFICDHKSIGKNSIYNQNKNIVYTNCDILRSKILEYYINDLPTDIDFCDFIIINDLKRESMNVEIIESLLNVTSIKVPKLIIITPFTETYAFPKFNSENDCYYIIKPNIKYNILYNFKIYVMILITLMKKL